MCVLQVHEHKTNNLYGAGRVAFSQQSAELLLNYGTGRLKLQESSVMMHPYADINCSAKFARNFKDVSEKLFTFKAGFSSVWSGVRQKTPALKEFTHTKYRYYIETMVSILGTISM